MTGKNPTKLLQFLFDKSWRAASPQKCLPPFLPEPPVRRTIVIGAGKASAEMAMALEQHWPVEHQDELSGTVLTRYGHSAPTRHVKIIEAAHPVPDEAGLKGTREILDLVSNLSQDDLVICLISGGGSALLTAPAGDITLAEKQDINRQLLASGAPIDEMNCLRKHLSAVKGGRLAVAAFPAKMVTLMISDVPGDDPSIIASGPTVADVSTTQQALAIVEKYNLHLPQSIERFLHSRQAETPNPGDPRLANTENHIIAAPAQSLEQAVIAAKEAGYEVTNLGDAIEGEAREVARQHAKLALSAKPGVIISGGETTVTIKGRGRGGRNGEYALALAIALDGAPNIHAIACDTDGIDGIENNAGAIITPTTLSRAREAGMDPQSYLDNNDAFSFFEKLGDLVITGPTRTNVNDFRAILINHFKA
ncbi:MAG TPA: glycerate kinase [Rhizobiales bacterium]|nr:glycerate kinase [Hyphomicrobiales bacterium]